MKISRYILKALKILFEALVNVTPFIMLFTTLLSGIFSETEIYSQIYSFLPDAIGYSILCNLVMVKLYFRKQFCFPTKVAVIGLICMNLTGLIYAYYGDSFYDIYTNMFDIIIVSLGFLVTILYYFVRWKY